VARGTQHRKRRPQANARAAHTVAAKPKTKKVKHASWEDELFFNRLRRHAKWVYILLALVFAGGFVFLGVGSGSTGIGDILQNFFDRSSSSGSSLSSLQSKVREHPQNATAWHDLATKLSQDQKIGEATVALERYTALRPRDESGLQELAALYSRQVDDYRNEASVAQAEAQLVAPGSLFQPAPSTVFGRLYQDPSGLQDKVSNAVTQQANEKVTAAYQKLAASSTKAEAVYKKLIKLSPSDATRQIQLAEAAQNAGDTQTAVAAYKKFLKLAPDDPLAPAVKQQLAQLAASSAASG
jgi:tetratricopeptide (TPR) repeat protein